MKNILNQLGSTPFNDAIDPITGASNKAIGAIEPIQRQVADPTVSLGEGGLPIENPTDLNFNNGAREMGVMMYGGNKARGIK